MARINLKQKTQAFTHESGPAVAHINPVQRLRRSVMACLLWEDQFYEDGASIADRISQAAKEVTPEQLAAIAIEARSKFNLRHVPLLLLKELAGRGVKTSLVSDTIEATIQRADELAEFAALYWMGKKRPLAAQVKKGLAKAFRKFNAYQLAKYNRDGAVKLRDVLFMCHAKPKDAEQAALWKQLVDGTLPAPDTWEVALSAGANKKETFERLLREGQLGYLALLRNLRNMEQAEVDAELIKSAILARKGAQRVYPFRYVAAARACPKMEPVLDQALLASIGESKPLSGRTIVLVDVSGSMDGHLSGKSDLKRIDAAAALASVINGDVNTFTFSQSLVECPPRKGMAGIDAIINSQQHGGTYLGAAIEKLNTMAKADRLIVITDEQSHDRVPDPTAPLAYMINVASYQNGVGYGRWTHLDGFSEQVIRYIQESEEPSTRPPKTA